MTLSGHAAATAHPHREWIPLLEKATREVFELMLLCQLGPAPSMDESGMDVTSMVGLAGQLCGVMTVRCHHQAAILMASKMLSRVASAMFTLRLRMNCSFSNVS